jgi:hypothetical protein
VSALANAGRDRLLFKAERQRYPAIDAVRAILGGNSEIQAIAIPIDCVDGFTEAFYARPEAFLDPDVRGAQSAWGFVDRDVADQGLERLRVGLATGRWDQRFGALRTPEFVGALRLIIARPA